MDTQKLPIEEACDIVGSQAEMARILDVSPAMVNQLVKGLRPVPIEHCLTVERATKGRVTRKALRPKDFDRIWGDPTHPLPALNTAQPEPWDGKAERRDLDTPGRRGLDTKAHAALKSLGDA